MRRRTGREAAARDRGSRDTTPHDTTPRGGAAGGAAANDGVRGNAVLGIRRPFATPVSRAVADALWRAAAGRMRGLFDPPLALPLGAPEQVLFAPPDILHGSAEQADAIYGGRYELAGHTVETRGASPFALTDAAPEWRRALHGFGWLRHAATRDDALARLHARALCSDWFREHGHPARQLAWEPIVTATRLRHWLAHSPLLLAAPATEEPDAAEGESRTFEDRFLRQIGLHRRALRRMARDVRDPLARLHALAGLVIAALAVRPTRRDEQRRLGEALDAELAAQILPDGGHVSRRSDVALDLLAALLPVRQCYVARGVVAPRGLLPTIDRMVPALAHLRLGDGSLARHNGTHAARLDRLGAVLALEGGEGGVRVPPELPDSGYHRLSTGGTVVVVDAGIVPPVAHAGAAHAGALSFEMSVGGEPLVVNLGASDGRDELARALRSTPAHSTLALDDASYVRIVPPGLARRLFGEAMVGMAGTIEVRRADASDGAFRGLAAAHDGYRAWGVRHERVLTLRDDGTTLTGTDRLVPAREGAPVPPATLRFHLHPSVGVERMAGPEVRLRPRTGPSWRFEADRAAAVEETLFCDGAPTPSSQIAVRLDGAGEVAWSFTREA